MKKLISIFLSTSMMLSSVSTFAAKVDKLNLSNSLGDRPAYAIREGSTIYADVTASGNVGEGVDVFFAQYDASGRLLTVAADKVTIEANKTNYVASATLSESPEGSVKAFAIDTNNGQFKPLTTHSSMTSATTTQFINDLEPYFYKYVSVVDATTVKQTNGSYYSTQLSEIHNTSYDVDGIFYDGATYNGQDTKVFAYIGYPKNASPQNPVPAVVCVHGAGGWADHLWVENWAKKGYAAISMSLYYQGPDLKDTIYASAGVPKCFDNVTTFKGDYKNSGIYYVMANLLCASNIFRQDPRIDITKIGICGVSYGGLSTTMLSGVGSRDGRFAFAIPCYGSGYLENDHSNSQFTEGFYTRFDNDIRLDPANFAALATCPILFVNSDADYYFSANTTTSTVTVCQDAYLTYKKDYSHKQQTFRDIAQTPEAFNFADYVTKTGAYYGRLNVIDNNEDAIKVEYDNPEANISSAVLYYQTTPKYANQPISDGSNPSNKVWTGSVNGTISGKNVTFSTPANSTFAYASIKDSRGNVISSPVIAVTSKTVVVTPTPTPTPAPTPTPTPSTDGDIIIQAEETTSYTVKGVAKTGTPTQTDAGGVGDFPKYYAAGAQQPTYGETGDGIKIASWGTMIYSVTLRSAGVGIDSLTYKFNVDTAGKYNISMRTGVLNGGVNAIVSVNGGKNIPLNTLTQNLTNYTPAFVWNNNVGSVELVKGENTITFTVNRQSYYFDCFKLTK